VSLCARDRAYQSRIVTYTSKRIIALEAIAPCIIEHLLLLSLALLAFLSFESLLTLLFYEVTVDG